jgi:hypothetical protein
MDAEMPADEQDGNHRNIQYSKQYILKIWGLNGGKNQHRGLLG